MPPTPPLIAIKRSKSAGSIIDLTGSDDDEDSKDNILDNGGLGGISFAKYPCIHALLTELTRECPELDFMQYEAVLIENGFVYVSQLVGEEVRRQLEHLGIRFGEMNLILSYAERIVRRTQKLKQED